MKKCRWDGGAGGSGSETATAITGTIYQFTPARRWCYAREMKTSVFQKWFLTGSVIVLPVLMAAAQTQTQIQPQSRRVRIGIYDSRAVAVAYANSREFENSMKPVQA